MVEVKATKTLSMAICGLIKEYAVILCAYMSKFYLLIVDKIQSANKSSIERQRPSVMLKRKCAVWLFVYGSEEMIYKILDMSSILYHLVCLMCICSIADFETSALLRLGTKTK